MAATSDRIWLVAMAASAGGIPALVRVLADIPATLPASIVIVLHRRATRQSLLDRILAQHTRLPVTLARVGERLAAGCVYIAPAESHLLVTADRRFAFQDGVRIRGVLSSANRLLETAAPVFGARMIAVVLTGTGFDATDGVQAVKASGGTVIVQDEATSQYFGMPGAAIKTGVVDRVLPLDEIAGALVGIVQSALAKENAGEGTGVVLT
jgi:two-component system chemotaxis response regulator CheB